MGASNAAQGAGTSFYSLKEIKEGQNANELRFFKREKDASGQWNQSQTFTDLSGKISDIMVEEKEWQGQKKKILSVILEDANGKDKFSLGLNSMTAKTIINTIASNPSGEFLFQCGKAREYNGKKYSTLWIKRNGEKTNWKFSKDNNNLDQEPKITSENIEGQIVKRGVAANLAFWENEIALIKAKIAGGQNGTTPTTEKPAPINNPETSDVEDDAFDVPF